MKVRQKSPIFDAVQFLETAECWPAGIERRGRDGRYVLMTGRLVGEDATPGVAPIRPGDWVLTHSDGRRVVVSSDDFREQYDEVDSPADSG